MSLSSHYEIFSYVKENFSDILSNIDHLAGDIFGYVKNTHKPIIFFYAHDTDDCIGISLVYDDRTLKTHFPCNDLESIKKYLIEECA
jgi:hypothetical protein